MEGKIIRRPEMTLEGIGRILLVAFLVLAAGCESREWRKANKERTIEAYQEYMEKYPEGKHWEEARNRMIGKYIAKVKRENTLEGYEEFLEKYPQAVYAREQLMPSIRKLVESEVNALSEEQIAKKLAVIETDLGSISFEFFPDVAPEHCRNFMKLARSHFYENLSFHQIVPDSLILGGAPGDDLNGGPGYTIKAEFNDRPHLRGTVGMYRAEHPNSAGSQFYICLKPLPNLDGNYTVFGQVTEGMEAVDRIAAVPTSGPPGYTPQRRIVIKRIEIRDLE